MEQKHRFVILAEREEQSFSRLCEEFGISRKSGYKWRSRGQSRGDGVRLRIVRFSPGFGRIRISPELRLERD